MSAKIKTTAPVHDIAPARLFRLIERQSNEPAESAGIMADLADGLEVIHQLANIAGYSKQARDLVFAVASRAYNSESATVELTDEELAKLQGCAPKTVQRQRNDYLSESRRLKTIDLIGIEEGEYDRTKKMFAITRYTFHLGGTVAAVVAEARHHPQWHEFDRPRQCEELKRVAAHLYDEIPEARPKPRKRRRVPDSLQPKLRRTGAQPARTCANCARSLPNYLRLHEKNCSKSYARNGSKNALKWTKPAA